MTVVRLFFCLLFIYSCNDKTGYVKTQSGSKASNTTVAEYFNYGDTGVQTAGIRMIDITTPVGNFKVWTKRFGNNPHIKILLLHGGPAAGHEYMECFESFLPKEGFEFYEYDQLGASYSDQKGQYLYCPNGSHLSMWDDQKIFMDGVIRFIREVDTRKA